MSEKQKEALARPAPTIENSNGESLVQDMTADPTDDQPDLHP